MTHKVRLSGARDGKPVELPQDLDALSIDLENGTLYIDLTGPVPGMVLMRAVETEGRGPARMILSPLEGRMAVGVIRSY